MLSEKKSIKWNQFKKYINLLKKKDEILKNKISSLNKKLEVSNFSKKNQFEWYNSIIRNLSSFGYIDIGETKKGEILIQVAPPMMIELPFIKLSFLLTGARSPDFLKIIKKAIKGCSKINIKKQIFLPDSIIIEAESQSALKKCLEKSIFQGNKLSSYIKISNQPVAWNILKFSGDLESYYISLKKHWHSSKKSDIKKFFDVDNLQFRCFRSEQDRLQKDLYLVKVAHYENFSKYYLFNKKNQDIVKVNLDWGRFLMTKQSNRSVLKYSKKTFELSSSLRLPILLERGLTLLSGTFPIEIKNSKSKKKCKIRKN